MASRQPPHNRPVEAAFALPIGFTALLVVAAVAAQAGGHLSAGGVLVLVCLVVGTAAVAEPLAAAPLTGIGWFTVAGFSGPPYGELQTRNGLSAAIADPRGDRARRRPAGRGGHRDTAAK